MESQKVNTYYTERKEVNMPMPLEQVKIKAFEYFINKLVEWYKEQNEGKDFSNNDLSKLKVIKLHFFVCASRANESEDGLLKIFDNFWALPYGHVESDIYESLNKLNFLNIDNQKLDIIENDVEKSSQDLDLIVKDEIDSSFAAVKAYNRELINYIAADLVELSHTWYSWKSTYKLARSFKKYSLKIPKEMIKAEKKFYKLKSA